MKSYNTIVIILLFIAAFLGGYVIFQNKQKELSPSAFLTDTLGDISGETEVESGDTSQKEFTISVGVDTQIFAIDIDDPYIGELPASFNIGTMASTGSFEIMGEVIFVDSKEYTVLISSDYPRPINKAFTPRGPKVSLGDIKEGDRIVANGEFDAQGEADYSNIEFIQITPSIEEIRLMGK